MYQLISVLDFTKNLRKFVFYSKRRNVGDLGFIKKIQFS